MDGLTGVLPLVVEETGEHSAEDLLLRWFADGCKSLSALHQQGMIHGDVSPRNLICDRGSLTLTDYDLVTAAGTRPWGVGAVAYCSPEAQRREPLEPSDDFFALASSLFETAFNHAPFPSPYGAIDKSRGLDWQKGRTGFDAKDRRYPGTRLTS